MPRFKYIAPRRTLSDGSIGLRYDGRVFRIAAPGRTLCEKISDLPIPVIAQEKLDSLADARVGDRHYETRVKPNDTLIEVSVDDFVAVRYFRNAKSIDGSRMYSEVL